MALHELSLITKIAKDSFRHKEMKATKLIPFAMQMDGDEEPVRMYDAAVSGIDGMLLITNKQLMFIGNDNGQTVGTKCPIESLKTVGHKGRGEFADITFNMDGEILTFTVLRFDVNRIKSQIG